MNAQLNTWHGVLDPSIITPQVLLFSVWAFSTSWTRKNDVRMGLSTMQSKERTNGMLYVHSCVIIKIWAILICVRIFYATKKCSTLLEFDKHQWRFSRSILISCPMCETLKEKEIHGSNTLLLHSALEFHFFLAFLSAVLAERRKNISVYLLYTECQTVEEKRRKNHCLLCDASRN